MSGESVSKQNIQKQQETVRQAPELVAKRNTMYLIILGVWIVSTVGLALNAAFVYGLPNSVWLWILVVLVVICLKIFWFYALYHYGLVVFRQVSKVKPQAEKEGESGTGFPDIALIYTTVDDFRYDAALRCVNQDYPGFHVFLIDVSQSQEGRQ